MKLALFFLIKPFRCMIKKSRQKLRYLENKKSFWGERKSIFHHFWRVFNCQKLSQTWECDFEGEYDAKLSIISLQCLTSLIILRTEVSISFSYFAKRISILKYLFDIISMSYVVCCIAFNKLKMVFSDCFSF